MARWRPTVRAETARPDDPAQGPGSPVHHRASRRQPPGRRSPPARGVGGRLRGARAAPLRTGAAGRRPSATGDRPRACLGAGRDHVGRGPRGGRPRQRRGPGPDRGRTARRVRCRPGRGGRPCGGARARCRRLRDQGCPGGRAQRARRRWSPGVPSGSAPSFPTRSGSSCSTTSGCATSCAGSPSTADRLAWNAAARRPTINSCRMPPARSVDRGTRARRRRGSPGPRSRGGWRGSRS